NRTWRDKDAKDAPKDINPVIRIKAPIEGESIIDDIIQGSITVSNEEMDDFIIMRSDGTPTYMLSVVVDDHDMNVTHIVRGHDHLTNTFRQNIIYKSMGWDAPKTAHIPLIHGSDGSKMSKRHGAIDVEEYKNNGILPDALINYMLRLGWSHGDDEIISLKNAIKWFKLEKIGKSPAKFDNDKLISVNSHYIKELDNNKIIVFLKTYYEKKYKIKFDKDSTERLNLGLEDIKSRSRDLIQLAEMSLFYCSKFPISISKKADKYIKKVDKNIFKDLLEALKVIENNFTKQEIEKIIANFLSKKGLKLSDIIQYIRAMITGLDVSPRIYDIMEILGFVEIKKRIEYFING
ncbi:MAG: glutamate--tRNA ligase, partial [Pelagibacteraceae bacterium]|nr:glutamate--tRNA ligase [Pelagibacteraceae bacterium]